MATFGREALAVGERIMMGWRVAMPCGWACTGFLVAMGSTDVLAVVVGGVGAALDEGVVTTGAGVPLNVGRRTGRRVGGIVVEAVEPTVALAGTAGGDEG